MVQREPSGRLVLERTNLERMGLLNATGRSCFVMAGWSIVVGVYVALAGVPSIQDRPLSRGQACAAAVPSFANPDLHVADDHACPSYVADNDECPCLADGACFVHDDACPGLAQDVCIADEACAPVEPCAASRSRALPHSD